MRRLLATIALLTLSGPALANDGPSYEETLKFIDDKTNLVWRHDGHVEKEQRLLFDDCLLTVKNVRYPGVGDGHNQTKIFEYTVDLEDLNPNGIDVRNGRIVASTFANKSVVRETITRENVGSQDIKSFKDSGYTCDSRKTCSRAKYYYEQISIDVLPPLENNAPRLAKAITHAVKICGGKDELF